MAFLDEYLIVDKNNAGLWQEANQYIVGDLVTANNKTYESLEVHTSGNNFSTDLTNLKWKEVSVANEIIDDLVSVRTDASLSANQGRVLKDIIDGKSDIRDLDNDTYIEVDEDSDGLKNTVSIVTNNENVLTIDDTNTTINNNIKINSGTESNPIIAFNNNETGVFGDENTNRLETISYDSISFDPINETLNSKCIQFNGDGTKIFVLGNDATNVKIHQYTLSTPYDITSMVYDTISVDISNEIATSVLRFVFSDSGFKLHVLDVDIVYQYTLSTAYDLSTVTYERAGTFGINTGSASLSFNDDGTKLYLMNSNKRIYQHSLPTPYDVQGSTYDSIVFEPTESVNQSQDMSFDFINNRLYISYGLDGIYEYQMSDVTDISSAVYTGNSFDPVEAGIFRQCIEFENDFSRMLLVADDIIYQYSMTPLIMELGLSVYGDEKLRLSEEDILSNPTYTPNNDQSLATKLYVDTKSATKYVFDHDASTDWTDADPISTITILESTHGAGVDPIVQLKEDIGGSLYDVVHAEITTNASGDVTVSVAFDPSEKYAGKIIII